MDTFLEQLVAKAPTKQDNIKKISLLVLCALLACGIFYVSMLFTVPILGIVIICGMFYGAYLLISEMEIEYEYIFTNGDLDIDKIIAKKKRKRLITVQARTIKELGLYKEASEVPEDVTLVIAASGYADEAWYADLNHQKHGKVRLIFSPDEKLLEAMEAYLPASVKPRQKGEN